MNWVDERAHREKDKIRDETEKAELIRHRAGSVMNLLFNSLKDDINSFNHQYAGQMAELSLLSERVAGMKPDLTSMSVLCPAIPGRTSARAVLIRLTADFHLELDYGEMEIRKPNLRVGVKNLDNRDVGLFAGDKHIDYPAASRSILEEFLFNELLGLPRRESQIS